MEDVQVFLEMTGEVPPRPLNSPLRLPVAGTCTIQGVGDVCTGHAEQSVAKQVKRSFLSTHTTSNPCTGMERVDQIPGLNAMKCHGI